MKRSLQLNPLNVLATWDEIRTRRDEIELLPITLDSGLVFDYDTKAMQRFERAIAQFNTLPTVVNGVLGWKLADNTVAFYTQAQLIAIKQELDTKQAQRAATIFVRAEQLAGESRTFGEIQDLGVWGL